MQSSRVKLDRPIFNNVQGGVGRIRSIDGRHFMVQFSDHWMSFDSIREMQALGYDFHPRSTRRRKSAWSIASGLVR